MMEEESARAMATVVNTKTLQLSVSLNIMVLFLWAVCSEFFNANETKRQRGYTNWGFLIGTITILFGFLFLALALPLLTYLCLNMSQPKTHEEAQGGINKEGEMKTVCKAISCIFVTMVTMFMLVWAIYTGFRLVTEPRKAEKNYPLAFPIGIVTVVFGSVYFIIGLAITANQVLDLVGLLQQKERKGSAIKTDVKYYV